MSLSVTTFTCTKCDFKRSDLGTWGTREYVLGNGLRIPLDWRLGWCNDCNGLAAVEALSAGRCRKALAEAQRSLDRAGSPPVRRWWQPHRFIFRGWWSRKVERWMYYACQVEDCRDALRLALQRTAQPRCLACGSRRVTAPLVTVWSADSDETKPARTGFAHPGCGGEIMMAMDGLRVGLKPSISRYTPEGEFIENEPVEGYTWPRGSYFDRRAAENNRIRGLRAPRAGRFSLTEWLRKHAD